LNSIGLEQLTQPLKDYVNDKIGSALSKAGRKVTRCDVTLTVDKNPSIELSQGRGTDTLRVQMKIFSFYMRYQ